MTMRLPAISGRAAISRAAAVAAPEDMPPGIPSVLASRRAVSKAVSFPMVTTPSIKASSRLPGLKPAPIP